tara:strand:+ start:60 stop:263 length:204 start_codon:yes stop_codon:yes gene_type:complete
MLDNINQIRFTAKKKLASIKSMARILKRKTLGSFEGYFLLTTCLALGLIAYKFASIFYLNQLASGFY